MLSIKKLLTKVLGNLKSLNGVAIPSNADLNDYNDVGQYYASSNAIASSLSNKPSDLSVSFTLIVLNKGGNNNQVIYANDGSIWFRTQYSGGWQGWMKYIPATVERATSGVITASSGYTVRYQAISIQGKMAFAIFAISRSNGAAFADGRTTGVAKFNDGYRTVQNVYLPITASTSVNGYLNRRVSIICNPSGDVSLDCHGYSDVKEINGAVAYILA